MGGNSKVVYSTRSPLKKNFSSPNENTAFNGKIKNYEEKKVNKPFAKEEIYHITRDDNLRKSAKEMNAHYS